MKYQLDKRYRVIGVTAFCVIAASLLFYYGIFHMKSVINGIRTALKIFSPLIYGVAIAYLLVPVVNFLENTIIFPLFRRNEIQLQKRGTRVVRWICVIFSDLFFLFIIIALLMMILPQFINSVTGLIYNFPSYLETIQRWINDVVKDLDLRPETSQQIVDASNNAQAYFTNNLLPQMQSLLQNVTNGIFDVIVFLKNFLIGLLISLYVLADKEVFVGKAKMVCYAALPGKHADFMIRSMRYTHHTFGGFISGKILDSAIIGVLCYIGTSFMGTPYALLISVIIGVTNVIPFFGPYIGAIPCLFLVLVVDPLKCLYFLIFILVLQQFDGNILGPKILGDSTGLSSFMVIVAILIGGGFFGVPGMILGVPVFAVVRTAFWKLVNRVLRIKEMPYEESDYLKMDRVDLTTKEILPLPEKKRTVEERHNIFMVFWNALMGVLMPIVRVILRIVLFLVGKLSYVFLTIGGFLGRKIPPLKDSLEKKGQSISGKAKKGFGGIGRIAKLYVEYLKLRWKNWREKE